MQGKIEELTKLIVESQAYKSMFRRGFEETPRNRVLAIMGNVFLHLHPAYVARHTLKFSHSWCMGGITFLLFLVLCFTGVFLCFYYHADKINAYKDMKYFEYDVPFGMFL
ncbi:MAG: cytochrome B6, partial [Planctomycetes bacterium]|nr:cytochrome B6 [Planctomycetota bacterium]